MGPTGREGRAALGGSTSQRPARRVDRDGRERRQRPVRSAAPKLSGGLSGLPAPPHALERSSGIFTCAVSASARPPRWTRSRDPRGPRARPRFPRVARYIHIEYIESQGAGAHSLLHVGVSQTDTGHRGACSPRTQDTGSLRLQGHGTQRIKAHGIVEGQVIPRPCMAISPLPSP